jgi:hypothetical protein
MKCAAPSPSDYWALLSLPDCPAGVRPRAYRPLWQLALAIDYVEGDIVALFASEAKPKQRGLYTPARRLRFGVSRHPQGSDTTWAA